MIDDNCKKISNQKFALLLFLPKKNPFFRNKIQLLLTTTIVIYNFRYKVHRFFFFFSNSATLKVTSSSNIFAQIDRFNHTTIGDNAAIRSNGSGFPLPSLFSSIFFYKDEREVSG